MSTSSLASNGMNPTESSSSSSSSSMIEFIEEYFKSNGDKRVAELRFMSNPWEVVFISLFYVYFCYDLGPHKLMKNRPAFDLVWTVRVFNTFILLLNVWILNKFFTLHNWGYDIAGCAPVDENDMSPKEMEHINVCHIFLYSRILELIDTLWITLRKKNRQITFLHVFHHSFVLLMTWFYFRMAPGGSSAMFPIVNGMVHTIMYIYYILSTFDSMKPYLWWKKYVTTIQLVQFIILGIHFAAAAMTPDCKYPRVLSLSGLTIAGMFFTLFIAFYRRTYPTAAAAAASSNTKTGGELCQSSNNNNNNNNNSKKIYYSSEDNNNNNHTNYYAKLAEAKSD